MMGVAGIVKSADSVRVMVGAVGDTSMGEIGETGSTGDILCFFPGLYCLDGV